MGATLARGAWELLGAWEPPPKIAWEQKNSLGAKKNSLGGSRDSSV